MDLKVTRTKTISGEITVPGDKSISHRAVMLGALAKGTTRIKNFLLGADCFSTIQCFKAMGVEFFREAESTFIVTGKGMNGLKEPENVLDVGNSGTTIRLMMGILAGQPFFASVTGDESIRKRPMGRIVKPLKEMGAVILGRQNCSVAPLAIKGGDLRPISYTSPVSSAQVKSAIILAGLYADGNTVIKEPVKSRDHTERMISFMGADLKVQETTIRVGGRPILEGRNIEIPGDISSAAFFMVAASIVPGSRLRINRVGLNPTRTGIIEVLRNMGADIEVINEETVNNEPLGDLVIRGGTLKGTIIEGEIIPRLIDEIPVITVAAAAAEGETVIRDAAELKVKETNRIATMAAELNKMGVELKELEDGLIINGGRPIKGAVCQSYGDHRVAMSMAVAGLIAEGETIVQDADCVSISFPGFENLLQTVVTRQ